MPEPNAETVATSPEAVAQHLAASRYLADESLATAIFLAIRLGKPLLLEGAPEAGVVRRFVRRPEYLPENVE